MRLAVLGALLAAFLTALPTTPLAGLAPPAAAAPPVPRVISPAAGQDLAGTVSLAVRATDTAEGGTRAGIVKVEWWLYACGSPANDAGRPCPAGVTSPTGFTSARNPEGKVLLGEATTPASGDASGGTWRSSWAVTSPVSSRGASYALPPGRYAVQAHVLDHAWEGTDPPATWGSAPVGVSPFVPVTIGSPARVDLSGFILPTAVDVLADGRVYVAEKDGRVRTATSVSATTTTTVIDIRDKVGSHKDHGLTSIAHLDGYLYTLYTVDRGYRDVCDDEADVPGARGCPMDAVLTRWPLRDDGTVGAESPVLGPGAWCAQFATHGGDDIEVHDGELWVSAGDGGGFNDADYGQYGGDPCGGHGALRSQAPASRPGPGRYDGKIIRISPTGTVLGVEAKGLRNPWRFTFLGNDLYTTDTGWYTWEEIDRVVPGGAMENFGWPCFEGPQRVPEYEARHLAPCEDLYRSGAADGPVHRYRHNSLGVSSITALAAAGGHLYFGDYTIGFIKRIEPDGSGERTVMTGVNPVDLVLTPSGRLLYVDIVAGAVRSVEVGDEPPPPPPPPTPTASISLTQEPWAPGDSIAFGVQSNVIEARQPHTITWSARLVRGTTTTALAVIGQGRPSASVVAPAAAPPASIEVEVTVTNSAGASGRDVKSVSRRAIDVPPGTNLLQNPGLEQDGDGDGVPDCWQPAGYGDNAASWRRTTPAHRGSWAEQLTVTRHVDGDRKLVPLTTDARCAPPVEPGTRYGLSLWYRTPVPVALEIVVLTRDRAGTWRYWLSGPGVPSSPTWTRAEMVTPAVPADVTSVTFGLALSSVGTVVTDDYGLAPAGRSPGIRASSDRPVSPGRARSGGAGDRGVARGRRERWERWWEESWGLVGAAAVALAPEAVAGGGGPAEPAVGCGRQRPAPAVGDAVVEAAQRDQ